MTIRKVIWSRLEDGSWRGITPIGIYRIFPGTGFSYETWGPVGGNIGMSKRPEDAMDLARKDYEGRIMSAFSGAPSLEAEEGGLGGG